MSASMEQQSPRAALVIDDSATVRRAVELAMPPGWVLDGAASGGEGIAKLSSGRYDVVFLDYVLPDMTGRDVWLRLQERADPPRVVLMTGRSAERMEELTRDGGPWASLAKPFTPSALQSLLARIDGPPREADPMALLAQELFTLLRPRLNQLLVPGGPTNPTRFAQRLFTPRNVAALRQLVLRHDAETRGGPLRFSGELSHVSAALVLRTLADGGLTGRLDVAWSEHDRVAYYVSQGLVVLTSANPTPAQVVELGLAPEALSSQDLTPRIDEEPLLLKWSAESRLPTERLRPAFARLTLDALVRLVRSEHGSFVWHDEPELPWWTEAVGQPTSLTTLRLELARREAGAGLKVDAGLVVQRAPGLGQRLRGVELRGSERRLLGLVDGQRTAAEIAERLGVPLAAVARELGVLTSAGLVVRLPRAQGPSMAPAPGRVAVAVDDAEFARSLAGYCASRAVAVVEVPAAAAVDALEDGAISACVVTAEVAQEALDALADHPRVARGEVRLVAVIDHEDATLREALVGQGFAVFAKPVAADLLVQACLGLPEGIEENRDHG